MSSINAMLDLLEGDPKALRESFAQLIQNSAVPAWLQQASADPEAMAKCKETFDGISSNGLLKASDSQIPSMIVGMSLANPVSVTSEDAIRLTEMYASTGTGDLNKDDLWSLITFVWFVRWLECQEREAEPSVPQEAPATLVAADAIDEAIKGEMRIHNMLDMVQRDRKAVGRLSCSPMLPPWLREKLADSGFEAKCLEKFASLDKNNDKSLEAKEVFPIIIELSQENPMSVTEEHCERLIEIFDCSETGKLSETEFLELVKFVFMMRWMEAEGEDEPDAPSAAQAAEEAAIDEMIETMHRDRTEVKRQIGRFSMSSAVPEWIRVQFSDEGFLSECHQKFDALDRDGNGVLSREELVPVILELSQGQPTAVNQEHCVRFMDVFDEAGKGFLSRADFVELIKFVWFMYWLEEQQLQTQPPPAAPTGETKKKGVEEYGGIDDSMCCSAEDAEMRVHALLDSVEHDRSAIGRLSVNPALPAGLRERFDDPAFEQECLQHFEALDANKDGSLQPSEVFSILVELSRENPYAVTEEHCERFVEIFDTEKTGRLSKSEFFEFVKFVYLMRTLETEQGGGASAGQSDFTQPEPTDGEEMIHQMLDLMQSDSKQLKQNFGRLSCSPGVPDFIQHTFRNEGFLSMCLEKFDALDIDKNGVLTPDEVYPVILELSQGQPLDVTIEHCMRFVRMFDAAGNGVLSRDEFTEFIKFVWFMRWLEEAQTVVPEEAPISDQNSLGELRIHEMLDVMQSDRKEVKNHFGRLSASPIVPEFIQKSLADEKFLSTCNEKFDALDVDRNGVLDPKEVFPIILELSLEQPVDVTYEHCIRFVEMFDNEGKGVLGKAEFTEFVKFVWFMRWLEQDAAQQEAAAQPASATAPAEEVAIDSMLDMMQMTARK
jgi:Ca2+-binding EF-hand superfamily protein